MDSISNGPKVPNVETAGLRHCTLRLYGDGVSALATDPAESAVRPSRVLDDARLDAAVVVAGGPGLGGRNGD